MRDRVILAALRAVPKALAEHVMFVLRSNPDLPDAWGHHIRPIHWGEPLPDFREITCEAAEARRVPSAIDFQLDDQRALQARLGQAFGSELASLHAETGTSAFPFRNGYFDGLDAAMYYALIRDLKPRHVIEIGSGFSSRIAARALERNRADGVTTTLTCIEPFPQPRLTSQPLPMTLVQQPVERIDAAIFEQLDANDILFIDSSHVARFGGDVNREFLDILPRLSRGVWVHVHDIFFPHDYPAAFLKEFRYAWNEQYMLEAFLKFNSVFAPAFCCHWMWSDYRDEVQAAWPHAIADAAGPQGPASFWMKRVD